MSDFPQATGRGQDDNENGLPRKIAAIVPSILSVRPASAARRLAQSAGDVSQWS